MRAIVFDPVTVARERLHYREVQSIGQNRGARIDGLIIGALGEVGQSWCCYFAIGTVLDNCFQGDGPFPRTQAINGSTVEALAYARKQGWEVPLDRAQPGDLVFSVHPDGTPHHVAILTSVDPFTTIAGNTSADGKSSNGDRVAENVVSSGDKVIIGYPRS